MRDKLVFTISPLFVAVLKTDSFHILQIALSKVKPELMYFRKLYHKIVFPDANSKLFFLNYDRGSGRPPLLC